MGRDREKGNERWIDLVNERGGKRLGKRAREKGGERMALDGGK